MFYVNISKIMENKTQRLLEAIDNPELISDEELNQMLEDSEIRKLYGLLNKAADALSEPEDTDIGLEWESFARKHIARPVRIKRGIISFINRHAAAILICAVSSLAVVAATIGIVYSADSDVQELKPAKELVENPENHAADITNDNEPVQEPVTTTVIFKNESLENIITAIAAYYGANVEYQSVDSKDLKLFFQWNREDSLKEVVEELDNFEQIKISLSGNTITVK